MVTKKHIVLYVAALVFVGIGVCAKQKLHHRRRNNPCETEKACLNNKDCQCYCSEIGDFRDKIAEDNPVYVENDPNEKILLLQTVGYR